MILTYRKTASIRLTVSASALAFGLLAVTPASADDIVVTGTRIEGVAPVGSSVIPVSREELEQTGTSTVNDALRKLPQIINFGGSDEQEGGAIVQASSLNTFFAKSVNLRGIGTSATLNLVNGHRVAPQGPNGQLYDADNIPSLALERVEVVADGGSAIYGSDAVAGVVNYITRRPEDTLEATFRYGFADDLEEYIASFAAGHTWDTGGVFFAYQYQDRGALKANDRPDLYNSDFSIYGLSGLQGFASPGNVLIDGMLYGIPGGQDGSALTLGDLAASPNLQDHFWDGMDAIPGYQRHSVSGVISQDLGPSITLDIDGFYSRREFTYRDAPETGTYTVTNANPFSPCYPGVLDDSATLDCPADGTLSVRYNFVDALGPWVNSGSDEIWSISPSLDIELGERWNANIRGYYSENNAIQKTDNRINASSLDRVLNGTNSGIDLPADIPFFNPFCDASEFDCNSDATLNHFRAYTSIASKYELYGGTASIDGAVFSIPGGDVRVAVGGEYKNDTLWGSGQVSTTGGPTNDNPFGIPAEKSREIKSVYGEVFLPIIGADNASTGLQRLELNAAVRYDDYSDVGGTTNPKFGVNFSPAPGLTFRGSYGTSFHAPSLPDLNKYAQAGYLTLPAPGEQLGLMPAGDLFLYQYRLGGNEDLQPETAETWSLGFDIDSDMVPGLRVSGTYYNIVYENKVDFGAYGVPFTDSFFSEAWAPFVVLNPNFYPGDSTVTEAEYIAYYDSIQDPGLPHFCCAPFGDDPLNLVAIIDGRRQNQGVVETDGLDFNFNYTLFDEWADFRFGGKANYVLSYKVASAAGLPLLERVNTFGYPAEFTGQLEFGIDKGGFTTTAYLNYVNSREYPRSQLAPAVPDSYTKIGSYTTVDLTISYAFEEDDSILGGVRLTATAQNLFDADPPEVVNFGTGEQPIRFDPSYSSSLGRFIALQISKTF